LRNPDYDAIKGALILAVIIGHVPPLKWHAPHIVHWLYTFNVVGFLLLPFLFAPAPFTRAAMLDRLARYGVPFLIFYAFYALAYNVIYHPHDSIRAAIEYAYAGIVIGTTWTTFEGCGLKSMWFLPALFTLTLARAWLADKKWPPHWPWLLLIPHLAISQLGNWRYLVPWGTLAVLYILPLGLALPRLLAWIERRRLRLHLLALCVVLHASMLARTDFKVDLGDLQLYGITNIPYLLLQDGLMLGTTLALFAYRHELSRSILLRICGRYSLPIYLTHSAAAIALTKIALLKLWPWPLQAAVVFALTVTISLAASVALSGLPGLYRRLFPRGVGDLLPRH
jgi:fucose 4-O-acetylase-like acetyltransferase